MQGGTIDRWKKLLQGTVNPQAIEEIPDEFVPADELDSWVSGMHEDDSSLGESYSLETENLSVTRTDKILPEARRVTADEKPIRLKSTTTKQISEVRSALGPGTLIEGKFTFDSPVKIDGTIRGEVHSSSLLIIGEDGLVEGLMQVGSLVVLGRAKGSIVVDEKVQIGSQGQVLGDIEGGLLAIELGGVFEGSKKAKR
jgi:cytoskeletal protein CcmA (bactofilin family)